MKGISKFIIVFVLSVFVLVGLVKFRKNFCNEVYNGIQGIYYTLKEEL